MAIEDNRSGSFRLDSGRDRLTLAATNRRPFALDQILLTSVS